jgi:hypothetical protein
MKTKINYIVPFLSSLLSWLLYSLESTKIAMLKRLIKWKRKLDYRVSPEILHYREQRVIERKITRHEQHYSMNLMHHAIKNAK